MIFRKIKRRNETWKEVFGAIDLGTNSCRLLVAHFDGQIRIVDSFSRVVRLGENLQQTGRLSSEAIERSLKALRICKEKLDQNKVTHLKAVTTEACRQSSNAQTLIHRVQEEIGINLEVILPEEEAFLALSGCSGVFQKNIPYALAFDIGGGSTEIMWCQIKEGSPGFQVMDWMSIPFGVVTLSDAYGSHATSPTLYKEIRDKVATELQAFSKRNDIQSYIDARTLQMVGTSGTVTTLAAIFLKLSRYDRYIIDGIYLQTNDLHAISQEILHMSTKERHSHGCIGINRADLVITGSAILEGILDAFPTRWLRVADRGVREGILMKLVDEVQSQRA